MSGISINSEYASYSEGVCIDLNDSVNNGNSLPSTEICSLDGYMPPTNETTADEVSEAAPATPKASDGSIGTVAKVILGGAMTLFSLPFFFIVGG